MSRVLVVHEGSSVGGAELSLCEFLSFVQQHGPHTPIVVCRTNTPFSRRLSTLKLNIQPVELFRITRARSVKMAAASLKALLRTNSAIFRLIRTCHAELIHANNTSSFLQCAFAARRADVPIIWHIRDTVRLPLGLHVLESWANKIIAVSRAAAEGSLRRPERAHVIHNGLALATEPEQRGGQISERQKFDLVMMSQFVPWKRHAIFIQAVDELRRRGRRVSAAIAGATHDDGQRDYAAALQDLVNRLDLQQSVTFIPYDDKPARILRQARALVHPAVGEPMGRVVGEAMCLGIPVVASRSGGIPEFVEDGKTGLLVAPDDPCAFADAIEKALTPETSSFLARNARRAASGTFDLAKQCAKVLAVYDLALERQKGTILNG